jgi:hypothetical protein
MPICTMIFHPSHGGSTSDLSNDTVEENPESTFGDFENGGSGFGGVLHHCLNDSHVPVCALKHQRPI